MLSQCFITKFMGARSTKGLYGSCITSQGAAFGIFAGVKSWLAAQPSLSFPGGWNCQGIPQ